MIGIHTAYHSPDRQISIRICNWMRMILFALCKIYWHLKNPLRLTIKQALPINRVSVPHVSCDCIVEHPLVGQMCSDEHRSAPIYVWGWNATSAKNKPNLKSNIMDRWYGTWQMYLAPHCIYICAIITVYARWIDITKMLPSNNNRYGHFNSKSSLWQ